MSGRTSTKCRLHGQIEPLKGHKRVCPFASCACARCASHDHILAHKNNIRVQHKHDKGRSGRGNLLQNSTTSTTTSTPLHVQFPEMQWASYKTTAEEPGVQGESTLLALQLANFEDSKAAVERTKTKAELFAMALLCTCN